MRRAEPLITTHTDRDGITVTAEHETPEGLRGVRSLKAMTFGAIVASGTVAAGLVLQDHPSSLTGAERLVVFLVVCGAMVAVAFKIAAWAADRRFGLRPVTDHRLTVALLRDAVAIEGRRFGRGSRIAFTAESHRLGRDEERSERLSGSALHETYRRAFEIKLQHGEAIVVLAAVADEEGANAIVRRLQSADDEATRGTGAFSKGTVFGPRQQPE